METNDLYPTGKKLGVVEDRRTIMAEAILQPDDVRVPKEHKVGGRLESVPMFGNDDYGDCVFASEGHVVVTHERSSSQREIPLTTEQILAAYARVTGFRPDDPSTDNGAYELDGLNYWRQRGLGLEKDRSPHMLKAFAAVEWTDHEQVKLAHYVFGGVKVCAGLPLTAADQLRAGDAWDLAYADPARSKWGSWGGHSMYSFAYDEDGLWVWTWSRPQFMTWAWVDSYVDESYALITEDYFRRAGRTPQGFDAAKLDRMLRAL